MYLFGIKSHDFKINKMRCFETFEAAFKYAIEHCKNKRDAYDAKLPLRTWHYDVIVYSCCIWEVYSDRQPVLVKDLKGKLKKELWPELHTSANGEEE
jgi:hypothetical protein